MKAAKGRRACIDACAEGTSSIVVLVAEGREVVGGAGHAEGAVVGACSFGVFVGAEDVAVDVVERLETTVRG